MPIVLNGNIKKHNDGEEASKLLVTLEKDFNIAIQAVSALESKAQSISDLLNDNDAVANNVDTKTEVDSILVKASSAKSTLQSLQS